MDKFIIFFLASFCLIQIINTQFICDQTSYNDFLTQFQIQKSKNQTQYSKKLNIYCQNLKHIQEVNAQNLGYTLKQFRWMDKTPEQLKSLIKVQINPAENLTSVGATYEGKLKKVSVTPAASVDYRTSGKVSSIKDQGACGCCWSFTTIGLYQSWMMLKGQNQYDLSEQYILECTTAYTKQVIRDDVISDCNGGVVDYSGLLMRRNGAPLETKFPYLGRTFTGSGTPDTPNICKTSQTILFAQNPDVTKFTVYHNRSATQMKQLITAGPVGALIYADNGFQTYSSGIYSGCPSSFSTSYNNINHAVVIVGYDTNGNYIIKNSWGTSWGTNGFGIISGTNNCGLSAFVYQYSSTASAGSGVTFTNPILLQKNGSGSWQFLNKFYIIFLFLIMLICYN